VLYPALSALSATGGVQLRLRLELLQATLCVVTLAIAAPWGIEIAAWAYAATVAAVSPLILLRALSRLPVEIGPYLAAQAPSLLATAVMAGGLLLLRTLLPADLGPLVTLGVLMAGGAGLYGEFVEVAFPGIAAEAWAAGRDALLPGSGAPDPAL